MRFAFDSRERHRPIAREPWLERCPSLQAPSAADTRSLDDSAPAAWPRSIPRGTTGPVLNQQLQQLERLRRKMGRVATTHELPRVDVECAVGKSNLHRHQVRGQVLYFNMGMLKYKT